MSFGGTHGAVIFLGMNEIYIGENLSVLKSDMLEKYHGKVKVIYTDPPYNTKKKKAYNDTMDSDEWANFMKERLVLCRAMLKENGVIFISIDDNEFAKLKVTCDSVFGEKNYIGTFITMQSQRSNAKLINIVHEYVIAYAKNKSKTEKFSIKRVNTPDGKELIDSLYSSVNKIVKNEGTEVANEKIKPIIKKYCLENSIDWLKNYANVDENGKIFFPIDLSTPGVPREVNIPSISLHLEPLKTRGWSTDEKFIEVYNDGRLVFRNGRPYKKHYLEESEDNASSVLKYYSRMGTKDLKDLGMDGVFDTPKPVELIKYLLRIAGCDNGDIVMDIFAGSGTMAQSVYEINKEDGKKIEYVIIQQHESITKDSESYNKCVELGIEPFVDKVMLYRINRFLEKEGKDIDYNLENS